MSDKGLAAPADAEEKKAPTKPHRLASRVRIMGKWQGKGYRPSKDEREKWEAKCKRFNLDPRTGAEKKASKAK